MNTFTFDQLHAISDYHRKKTAKICFDVRIMSRRGEHIKCYLHGFLNMTETTKATTTTMSADKNCSVKSFLFSVFIKNKVNHFLKLGYRNMSHILLWYLYSLFHI